MSLQEKAGGNTYYTVPEEELPLSEGQRAGGLCDRPSGRKETGESIQLRIEMQRRRTIHFELIDGVIYNMASPPFGTSRSRVRSIASSGTMWILRVGLYTLP